MDSPPFTPFSNEDQAAALSHLITLAQEQCACKYSLHEGEESPVRDEVCVLHGLLENETTRKHLLYQAGRRARIWQSEMDEGTN